MQDDNPLAELARFGTAKQLGDYIEKNSVRDLDLPVGIGGTLLGEAVKFGNIECVRVLVERGADVNYRIAVKAGDPPLKIALDFARVEIFFFLVQKGGDPSIPGWMGISTSDRLAEVLKFWEAQRSGR
jgi:hypothetical protein